jgi:hypothetical protein
MMLPSKTNLKSKGEDQRNQEDKGNTESKGELQEEKRKRKQRNKTEPCDIQEFQNCANQIWAAFLTSGLMDSGHENLITICISTRSLT